MTFLNWPNIISLARLLSVPLIINLILCHHIVASFWIFLCASASDAIDGYLARKLKTRTELGSFLDPLADKALLISVYLTLSMIGFISPWIVTLVIFRDILIIGGTILLFIFQKRSPMNPLMISKINTCTQILFVTFVLFDHAFKIWDLPILFSALEYLVALTTLLSGAFYVRVWFKKINTP